MRRIGILDNLDRGWVGDPVIHHGLLDVIAPEIGALRSPLKVGGHALDSGQAQEMDRLLLSCEYVVKPGTPSWYRDYDEHCWRRLLQNGGPHISFLGIGTGVPETARSWEIFMGGQRQLLKEVRPLCESGLIDVVVCRDSLTERIWSHLPIDPKRVLRMPCPGVFYSEPRLRTSKSVIALDVADDRKCSKARDDTFAYYYDRLHYLREGFLRRGCEVRVQTHERDQRYIRERGFPEVVQFGSREEMVHYYSEADVYVGAKVHGALSCAGSGSPALLLGVDGRQSAAWEVPDVVTVDIESGIWHPERVLAWWDNLDAEAVSHRLLAFRERKLVEWRTLLRDRLPTWIWEG